MDKDNCCFDYVCTCSGCKWACMRHDNIKRCLMCIESSNLPIETLHPHEVPPGPWVKLGMDFLQDHHGKKYLIIADCFSKFPYIFSVASAHHFKAINHLRELFTTEGVPAIVMSDNGLHSMEMNSKGLLESSTLCTPHHHLISTSRMVSLRPWWRRSRMPTRKLIDLPMLKQEHYFSYETSLSQQIFQTPAEILHGRPGQGAVLSRPSKQINIVRFIRDWNTEHTEGTVWQSTQSKGSTSAQSEWTSTVLSQQKRDGSPSMVDRNCNWNLGLWPLIHDPRP